MTVAEAVCQTTVINYETNYKANLLLWILTVLKGTKSSENKTPKVDCSEG